MYATVGKDVPNAGGWAFEPKYDGVRVLAFATARSAKLITRNGKDKAAQFPEVAAALRALVERRRGRPLVLDGEIVALRGGEPARFQQLQTRMHLKDERALERELEATPAALIAFDLLVDGDDTLTTEPWSTRRRRLERVLDGRRGSSTGPVLLGDSTVGNGDAMLERARRAGWEGIIAKRIDARYVPGARSRDWLKLKVEFRQEFVIGGFTEPRNTRPHLGALLLGYFEGDRFIYVGHTGGGFTHAGLKVMRRRLEALERSSPPFETPPRTNEPAHWVTPRIVVEVKFAEWTADGRLRQPIYLGTRDDKDPRDVGREATSMQRKSTRKATGARKGASPRPRPAGATRVSRRTPIETQLTRIEEDGGAGTLLFPNGVTLSVTSLDKAFFDKPKLTKGDLMRYYARVAPALLPLLKDRPLSLKRYPNGAMGMSFFQQNAGDSVPDGVRVADVEIEDGRVEPRFIGGDLPTLLHTVQLGTIAVNPWHSRLSNLDRPDYAVLDLDPGPRVPFGRIVEVARLVHAELEARGLRSTPKTSGSRGIHIVIPLSRRADYDEAAQLAEEVAAAVVDANPRIATIERALKARPAGSVYVDHMQNARGKTLASAFSARATPDATVSMPLAWSEVKPGLDLHAFTIETVPRRLARARTLWERGMKGK